VEVCGRSRVVFSSALLPVVVVADAGAVAAATGDSPSILLTFPVERAFAAFSDCCSV